jgi:SOUL heme-binding protein
MLDGIAGLVRGVAGAVGATVGVRHGTEEPTYTAEQLTSRVEIRHYGPRVAAETIVTADEVAARSDGFRRLAGYIFGGNQVQEKIAMTAPVAQQDGAARGEVIPMTAPVSASASGKGEWLIRFFMPAGKPIESLPQPNDQAVQLVTVPAETVAVRRFSGSTGSGAVARETAQLRRTMKETGFEPIGALVSWFYDPPWTLPVLRRNEIAIPVEPHS